MNSKKDRIFQAVIDHLKNEGFLMNLTIAKIAKKADVGKGTVYEYFNSKEELIAETIIYMLEKNNSRVLNLSNDSLNFKDSLLLFINKTFEILIENTNIHTILMSEEIYGLINHQLKQKMMVKIMELKKDYIQYLMSIINKGVNEGKFNPIRDSFIAISISNLIVTNIMYFINHKDEYQKDEFIDKMYQLILKLVS
ncbi:TetR/AcrR family transcriptional regulator [Mycoplasmatota bacterium]|nr:TetR/AcrR family transcriptional regulator [Mycoplasmatota bacterium]